MTEKPYFCPRLADYILVIGNRNPSSANAVAQTPQLLRRYPHNDHKDFPLPPDVVFFCQPEGCINISNKSNNLSSSFVFTLTEKDSGRKRFGICLNFYRPFDKRCKEKSPPKSQENVTLDTPKNNCDGIAISPNGKRSARRREKVAGRKRSLTMTSLCLISHHPFFSKFRDCMVTLRRIIDACNLRSLGHKKGARSRNTVWSLLTGQLGSSLSITSGLVLHELREIELWILKLLSAPICIPGKTKVEISIMPKMPPLVFALPEHTRFSLVDFPLHLPLELLGVDTCLKVITCIMLENKVIMQSRDYNAVSMSVMAFVAMLYPLEYMFPVIPLLPTCMNSCEQLLLSPTPYIIGVPASFFLYKKNFRCPDDIWVVDLDSNKVSRPSMSEDIPQLPEPEGTVLKNHLRQALMSMNTGPVEPMPEKPPSGFNPLIYGNDIDSVDIATRVAMVRFFNSPNTLGNFMEHTRTLRLYPRPVVAFQLNSFLKSRKYNASFTNQLARTQAVEYFAEWSLSPANVVFLRVQTGVYDPLLIGDKSRWYSEQLQNVVFNVYNDKTSTLATALDLCTRTDLASNSDDSSSDSTSSSSYSSLTDFVLDIQNSDINGETPNSTVSVCQLIEETASVYKPPSELQMPPSTSTTSTTSSTSTQGITTSEDSYSSDCSDSSISSSDDNVTNDLTPPRLSPALLTDYLHDTSRRSSGQSPREKLAFRFDSLTTGNAKNNATVPPKLSRPFAPLGNRKALVEKSGLVKHQAGRQNQIRVDKQNSVHSENQQFLKDLVTSVLDGQGVGWLKNGRTKKLMVDENYRNFVVSRLNVSLDIKLKDENSHIDDVCVSRAVFKGIATLLKALIFGLETTYQNQGVGGMASSLMVLEIMHTHYWEHDKTSSDIQSMSSSPYGSKESLCSVSTVESNGRHRFSQDVVGSNKKLHSPGDKPVTTMSINGSDYENIDVNNKEDLMLDRQYSSGYGSESAVELNYACKRTAKSRLTQSHRYQFGELTPVQPAVEVTRTYLFEQFLGKNRSWLWDKMQYWEDCFLDSVAQERDIIGMDQGPGEMIDRYLNLGSAEQKRLEINEDSLLVSMLYNTVAFMTMMSVSKNELKRKVRRLLAKSHIGLVASEQINTILECVQSLYGNDIDLRPLSSRLMQKISFTIHWGSNNTGDMLFMEVCDDCLILRTVTGSICDRWFYEKLVNMTYCPKTKVLCLWRKFQGKTQLNKFYTKKCKELYFSVKTAMERAAARNNGKIPGPDLGGEFPIQDVVSGEGGLLQVCMEGIGLVFSDNKLFIELSHIKRCFTQKGQLFVIEELDPRTMKINQRKYRSSMAADALMSFHRCVSICDQVMKSNNNNHTFESLQS